MDLDFDVIYHKSDCVKTESPYAGGKAATRRNSLLPAGNYENIFQINHAEW